MRTVVNSAEVFHLWANEAQSSARNSGDSVSFNGSEVRSYSTVIGKIVRNAAGERAYLLNLSSYSITTSSKHQGPMRQAVPRGETVFTFTGLSHGDGFPSLPNLLLLKIEEIGKQAETVKKARSNRPYAEVRLTEKIEEAVNFCNFFGLDVPPVLSDATPETVSAAVLTIRENAKRLENERIAKRDSDAKVHLDEWLSGLRSMVYGLRYQYMRVKDSNIETTSGAVVPVAQVKRFVPVMLAVLDALPEVPAADTLARFGLSFDGTVKFGPYSLTEIDAKGTVTVGCHRFEASEIRRIAALLTA
jgi:hypothetical protein